MMQNSRARRLRTGVDDVGLELALRVFGLLVTASPRTTIGDDQAQAARNEKNAALTLE
jgi:hypothetical protein